MPASLQSDNTWIAKWLYSGTDRREATERFERLPAAKPCGLVGLWAGWSLPTGHPLDGLLERLNWYGKEILPDGGVHPLLFRQPSGHLAALDPAWMPTGIALHWPALAHSSGARMTFQAASPLLRASGPGARIELQEFRGQRVPAIVYTRQPIVDYLRELEADQMVGLMERRGMTSLSFSCSVERPIAPNSTRN
jgi:hypothetical protein